MKSLKVSSLLSKSVLCQQKLPILGTSLLRNLLDVALNKWHTIRVSITPSENGDGTSKVNGILDGVLRYTGNLAIDLSELQYGLGIAYDAMHQDAYGRKFFTGKIGYIRYGKIK